MPNGFFPPHAVAASYMPRPMTIAPERVIASSSISLSSPVASPVGWSSYVHGPPKTHQCSRSPRSPSPLSGPSFGPVMYPSIEVVMPAPTIPIASSCSCVHPSDGEPAESSSVIEDADRFEDGLGSGQRLLPSVHRSADRDCEHAVIGVIESDPQPAARIDAQLAGGQLHDVLVSRAGVLD